MAIHLIKDLKKKIKIKLIVFDKWNVAMNGMYLNKDLWYIYKYFLKILFNLVNLSILNILVMKFFYLVESSSPYTFYDLIS
jgi:hypothetical protein